MVSLRSPKPLFRVRILALVPRLGVSRPRPVSTIFSFQLDTLINFCIERNPLSLRLGGFEGCLTVKNITGIDAYLMKGWPPASTILRPWCQMDGHRDSNP